MDPAFGAGGGMSGGSATSGATSSNGFDFGGFGTQSFNFGTGSASASGDGMPSWVLIAGGVALLLVVMAALKK